MLCYVKDEYIKDQYFCVYLPVTSPTRHVKTTSLVGDTVVLPCQSLNKTDVDWTHKDTPISPVYYVYTNGVEYDMFKPRFRVDRRPNQSEYDLVISRVRLTDAGLYICTDVKGIGDQLFVYKLNVITGRLYFVIFHRNC